MVKAESFAFGCLQAGPEFRRWLEAQRDAAPTITEAHPPLLVERAGTELRLVLNRPDSRNAINAALRDALSESLDVALADPTIGRITLGGAGDCFSIGGDITEFGQVSDPVTAHWIRSLRLPAWRLAALSARLVARVQGGVIGAGVEMAAFAAHVVAEHTSWFQLPELRYGLLPGAGGAVSVTRRIGRQRMAYMALSMRRIPAKTALEWGLVDELL